MSDEYRAWTEISLDAISHNVKEIKKCLKTGVKLMGVVKADAYGHGAFEVAEALLENGTEYLAVAFCDEAVELRKQGVEVPILVLGNSIQSDIESLIDFGITVTVSDYGFAKELSDKAVEKKKDVLVHVKIDTGMSRIGFLADSEENLVASRDEILRISKLPNIMVEGMFTHFASADEVDEKYTYMQYKRFVEMQEALEEKGMRIPIKHVCNSAGLVKFPEMQLDMVRAGIILYGMYPSADFDRNSIRLVPAMKFKTRITQIKELDEGVSLSYGMTHTLEKRSEIATMSVGYADGYPRNLSNKAKVLVKGQLANQLGRICMDQCMIDVTKVNNINVGDEVTLFGDAEASVSVDRIAELLGTINYEVTCGIGRRVPRIYIKNGKIVKVRNYILD